jgi:hypothetical protein
MTDTTHVEGADNDPDKPSPRVGRRALMLGATAAGVGGAASLVAGAGTADAANGGDVLLGKKNTATATTTVTLTGDTHSETAVYGVDKTTGSGGGAGVQGTSKNGTGVLGQVGGSTTGQRAVYGIDQSSGGGYGVVGTSTDGTGVYGSSSATFPTRGTVPSPIGSGVYGIATAEVGFGVLGVATGGGYGITGVATGENGFGVCGQSTGTGDSYGVYAASDNSYALYADGDAEVFGTLSKSGGSFKIDHPVDPGNKYLYHSFVESPDMKNVYDGTVTLDSKGQATVGLPDWFESLNRDFRYTLTALDEPAPDLHISSRVANGAFSIAGGKSNQEVSWQVTGIRQDAWANANRIPVEVDKKAEDQGRYLHPELFGGEAITALAKARAHGHRHHSNTPTT